MIFKSLSPDTHLCHRSVHVPVLKPLRFTLLRFISTVAGRLALPITGPKVISHGRAKLLLSRARLTSKGRPPGGAPPPYPPPRSHHTGARSAPSLPPPLPPNTGSPVTAPLHPTRTPSD